MKIKLISEEIFTLVIGETEFKGMRKVSEWKGFVEIAGPAGIAILTNNEGNLSLALKTMFGSLLNPSPGADIDWFLIKASPIIWNATKPPEPPPQPSAEPARPEPAKEATEARLA